MSGSSPLITATKTAPKRGGRVFIVMAESLASLHVGVRCVAQHAGRGRPGHRARGAAVHIRQQGRSRPRRARERRSASPAATACVTDGHPQFQFLRPLRNLPHRRDEPALRSCRSPSPQRSPQRSAQRSTQRSAQRSTHRAGSWPVSRSAARLSPTSLATRWNRGLVPRLIPRWARLQLAKIRLFS